MSTYTFEFWQIDGHHVDKIKAPSSKAAEIKLRSIYSFSWGYRPIEVKGQ